MNNLTASALDLAASDYAAGLAELSAIHAQAETLMGAVREKPGTRHSVNPKIFALWQRQVELLMLLKIERHPCLVGNWQLDVQRMDGAQRAQQLAEEDAARKGAADAKAEAESEAAEKAEAARIRVLLKKHPV